MTGLRRTLARLPLALLLAVVLLSPLPLGSNRPLFVGLLACAAALALMLWGYAGHIELQWRKLALPLGCFALVWLWAALSTLIISVDRMASIVGLMQMSAYFALFVLTLQLGRDMRSARLLVKALALSGIIYAAYGLGVYALGNEHVLWLEKRAYADSLTGTFINRNSFAAYAGMCLLAALALLAHVIGREDGRLRRVLSTASGTFWLLLPGSAILALALVLSASRAGLFSTAIGLLALGFGLAYTRLLPRRWLLGLGLCVGLIVIVSIALVGDRLLQRADLSSLLLDDRPQIWLATTGMIADAPLTGHGLNTYDQMFLQYRTPAIRQNYTRAHSTYLETAAELGMPAASLYFGGFALLGLFLLRGQHIRRQNRIYPVLGFALLMQAGTHALVDFSFQIPANAAILSVLLGVGVAQSFSSQQT